MTDLEPILTLWQELHESGTEYVLASIVDVEGSGYRKPGAMMILAADGRKCGTISGGCLEAEVAKKAFWHTANGPVVKPYSTRAEDGDVPFGMGCGGVVHLLLERSASALPFLVQLAGKYRSRQPLAVSTVLSGGSIGQRCFWPDSIEEYGVLQEIAARSYEEQRSFSESVLREDGSTMAVHAEYRAARPGLYVFGAGDDAIPLVRQAKGLGWYVALADGRSHLATRSRFPEADEVHVVPAGGEFPLRPLGFDAAAVMTHSLEQDTYFLKNLFKQRLGYLGVLGPLRRTQDILETICREFEGSGAEQRAECESWKRRVHAPMGLDLGGDTPADIALSVIAEIQQTLRRASGMAIGTLRKRQLEEAAGLFRAEPQSSYPLPRLVEVDFS